MYFTEPFRPRSMEASRITPGLSMPPTTNASFLLLDVLAAVPAASMALAGAGAVVLGRAGRSPWHVLQGACIAALLATIAALAAWGIGASGANEPAFSPWLRPTALGLVLALLVQFLGTVIAAFSSRYLQGEPGQG